MASWFKYDWFQDKVWGLLYRVVCNYGRNKEISVETMTDAVARSTQIKAKPKKLLQEKLGQLAALGAVKDGEFDHAVFQMRKDGEKNHIFDQISEITDVLAEDKLPEARRLIRRLPLDITQFSPSNSSLSSSRAMQTMVPEEEGRRFPTGFDKWDECLVGGPMATQLVLLLGRPGEFKSTIVAHVALKMFYAGGSGLFVSLDMTDTQLKALLICQHAFKFRQPGLDYLEVQRSSFAFPEDAELYKHACHDYDTNNDYGDIVIWEPPAKTTVQTIWQQAEEIHRTATPLDGMFIDHAQRLTPIRKRPSRADEVGETATVAKEMAKTFDDRRGLIVYLLWQASRAGKKEAEELGHYTLSALADSADAERNADVVLWTLQTTTMEDEHEVKLGCMKNRTGPKNVQGFFAQEDMAHGVVHDFADTSKAVREPQAKDEDLDAELEGELS